MRFSSAPGSIRDFVTRGRTFDLSRQMRAIARNDSCAVLDRGFMCGCLMSLFVYIKELQLCSPATTARLGIALGLVNVHGLFCLRVEAARGEMTSTTFIASRVVMQLAHASRQADEGLGFLAFSG